ncbi:hypothetical protein AMS68_007481 [Peltaster fructicola]|uniref:UBX domain-containing protein n=1 Tax=Peltaster fructicola TaxID=286661 RepID=A0A6H0Y4M3_9PEZI|nr:hypothetical protein AMS68_007481 [Peltaster fructicola]
MDANEQELIAAFCGITGASASTAQSTLAAADYDIEAAIALFYAASDGGAAEQDEASDSQEQSLPQAQPSQAPAASSSSRRAPQNSSKLRTLRDLQASANDDDDEEERDQDLFAGGEKSGLAVQNPNSSGPADHFRNILNRARQNPERPPPTQEQEPQRQSNFHGRAQTLGGDEAPSRVIEDPTSRRGQRPVLERITRTLHLWADGVSVDDGPLIRFDDPANAHIVAQINQGRAPLSLLDVAPDQEVDLNLEPHKDQNYVQPKKVYKAFSGSGQRLGSPTPGPAPATTSSQPAAPASSPAASAPTVKVDESAPTVTLQLRLGNGSRMTSRFNTSHTIADVYGFVDQATDQATQRPYVLVTTFPTRELSDRTQALSDVSELKRGGTVQQKYL